MSGWWGLGKHECLHVSYEDLVMHVTLCMLAVESVLGGVMEMSFDRFEQV